MEDLVHGISLSKFVSLAITEVAKGVSDAASSLAGEDVLINPITDNSGFVDTARKVDKRNVQTFEFDLTVSASSDSATGGGGSINVLGVSIGRKVENTHNNLTTSRLKFAVPVSFSTNTTGATREDVKPHFQVLGAGASSGRG